MLSKSTASKFSDAIWHRVKRLQSLSRKLTFSRLSVSIKSELDSARSPLKVAEISLMNYTKNPCFWLVSGCLTIKSTNVIAYWRIQRVCKIVVDFWTHLKGHSLYSIDLQITSITNLLLGKQIFDTKKMQCLMKSWISNNFFGAPPLIMWSNDPRRYRLITRPGVTTWIINRGRQISFSIICTGMLPLTLHVCGDSQCPTNYVT